MKFLNQYSLTALLFSAFCVTACGGGGSSSGGVTPVTPVTPVPPTDTSPKPTVAEIGDILVNQNEYFITGQKLASLVQTATTPMEWQLIDTSGTVYMSGMTTPEGASPLSGLSLHAIDFSAYQSAASNVQLKVGDEVSETFNISAQPYKTLAIDSAKYYYQSRAAEAVDPAYVPVTIPALSRPAGHVNQSLNCFSGTDSYGTIWPSCGYNKTISRGWYDAGDYGMYAPSTGMTVWTMQNQYETLLGDQNTCKLAHSATQDLNIPESQNIVHDLLDESRVGMEFLLSLQVETDDLVGMVLGQQTEGEPLPITQMSAKNMVHHKVHGLSFPADDVTPAEDIQPRYLYPPSTAATLQLAATGAQCARIWENVDVSFAARCKAAAISAYAAAKATPNAYAYDNFDGGGPYADTNLQDEFGWAATELFLTTGESTYSDDMAIYLPNGYQTHGRVQPSWRDTEPLGMMSIATQIIKNPAQTLTPLETDAMNGLQAIATQYAEQTDLTGFNVPDDNPEYYWGSNSNLLNRAVLMGIVSDAQAQTDYTNEVTSVMDYMLGHNPLNQSYISGFGTQSLQNPHHRFWSNIIDSANPKPPAGVLSGGPNNVAMVDPISSQLVGQCVAQTCWVDDFDAYTFNEVGIAYNAPLLWVSEWVSDHQEHCQN